jgi:prophage antirepressor-like protein
MTEELATLFEGKEIRAIEHAGEIWMPCRDLSLALGLDRSTLYHHVKRNREFFGDTAQDGDKLSPDDGDLWVNEAGLYTLLARISIGRVTPAAKTAIIQFRKSVPMLIQQYRKKEIIQTSHVPELDKELARAKLIAQETGGNLIACQKIALERCGYGDYVPALDAIPAYAHGEHGWHNITGLVALCHDADLTPERLNNYLHNNPKDPARTPFQERDENHLWRLTPLGREHGREYDFHGLGGHVEPRIEWRESILYACGLLSEIQPAQIQTRLGQ